MIKDKDFWAWKGAPLVRSAKSGKERETKSSSDTDMINLPLSKFFSFLKEDFTGVKNFLDAYIGAVLDSNATPINL